MSPVSQLATTDVPTSARRHGLLVFSGSLIAAVAVYWLLFHFLTGSGTARLPAYPLALPLVGMMIGALELITGAPISQIDKGWQRLPVYVQAPVAIVGSLGFLWGLIKLLGF
jgi:hypothetical protein